MSEIQSNGRTNTKTLQVCGFRVGQGHYAVPVLDVQEVVRPQFVTPVPLARPHVRGLINLRGQIVTAISLRELFHLEENLDREHMNVIVRGSDGPISLVVDEILDVIDLEEDCFEETPSTLPDEIRKYIKGVFKLEGHLMILINLEQIFSI